MSLLSLYMLAAFAGACVQVGTGIGYSIIVAPMLVWTMGAKTSVPLLLALNLIVSLVALLGLERNDLVRSLLMSLAGTLVGIGLGSLVVRSLPEPVVIASMAVLLIGGAAVASVPARQAGTVVQSAIGLLAGLATVATATPGPVMALGLILSGAEGPAVRRRVQPIAAVAYAAALASLGPEAWHEVIANSALSPLLLATGLGSVAGLVIGPKLPSAVILAVIRIISAGAGVALLARLAQG
ncbi:MAG: TSUP family transporter [Hyphomicrobiaceae bacterium]